MKNRSNDQPPEARDRGHETRDVSVRGLLIFALSFILVMAAILGGMWIFEAILVEEHPADTRAMNLPPDPALQVAPPEELKELREKEERILNSYRWINREDGVVGIPVERAMDLVAERGLPVREEEERP